jgi:hypothetical protein
LRHRREARAGRHAPQGDGLALRSAPGGIHQSIRQLRPDPWPDPTCGDFAGRAFAGAWNPAIQVPAQENYPRIGVAAISKACAVWRFGNSREAGDERVRGIDQSPLPTSDSATNYFLGALGRRCRKRTPGPPPFSSMNSTPEASKARRTAKSFAAVSEVWSSAASARRIVFRPKAASRARSSTVHLIMARAARI